MSYLSHHGIKGQKHGVRRWQYEDGSLTPAGREHYGYGKSTLTGLYGNKSHIWDRNDYTVPAGTVVSRRSTKQLSSLRDDERPYSYVYDDSNDRDEDFYKQFGKEKSRFKTKHDVVIAGMDAIAKTFDKAIFEKSIDDIDPTTYKWLDVYLDDKSNGQVSLKSAKYNPRKTPEENKKEYESSFSKAASRVVAISAGKKRNDNLDRELMEYDGRRDSDTALNDFFLNISKDLSKQGYSGIRDYKDAGGMAGVISPTILFSDNVLLTKIEDL